MSNTKSRSRQFPFSLILGSAGLLIGALCFFSGRWFVTVYGRIGFDSILYTLRSSLSGVQSGLLLKYLYQAALPAVLFTALMIWLLFSLPRRKQGKYQSGTLKRRHPLAASLLVSAGLTVFAAFDTEFVNYIADQSRDSKLYETHYVDPKEASITFPEKKRNLIYIILESMETTYLSQELGGAMPENLIPELYQLAEDNITFYTPDPTSSYGYYTTSGATWTIGSMVAQTAGIPLKTPTDDVNQYGVEGEAFLPGVTSLMDILHDAGYYQQLMVGSDVAFGGREAYYSQHGVDKICDLYTAREYGIIPDDYFVWWGMEDKYLFEFAALELEQMIGRDQPFAFTLLTVDTHHVGGYQCELCQPSTSGETYDQSISCSSRQVSDFLRWLEQMPFYENTTVIIVGDHESMDNGYMERNVGKDYQRLLYNCFVNSAADTTHTGGRLFCAEDLFPTTLAALGCEIEGDRLGLGTNLFSGRDTLMETYGFEQFNKLLAQSSSYYEENFWN